MQSKKQGDNSQARRLVSLFSQKLDHTATPFATDGQIPRLTKHLIFRDGVNRNNYDTLITALILAGLVFWLMAPTAGALHRWSPETSGARSDPVLLSTGGRRWFCQTPPKKVPTAAAKCVYSCAASNIHQMPSLQCVMWGNQHFTGCQMMSKVVASWQCQKETGSNTHIRYTGFFLVQLLTDEVPHMLKY